MSDLPEILGGFIGPDTIVELGDTGIKIPARALLTMIDESFDDDLKPKRGSTPYRELISAIAEKDALGDVYDALGNLYRDFGWRGPVDLMTEWVIQIECSPFMTRSFRDITGAVDLSTIILTDPNEEHQLRVAIDQSDTYERNGDTPPHRAFQKAMKESERSASLVRRWSPYFRNALAAAHQTAPTLRERAVFAELFKSPYRTDPEEIGPAAVVLGTAAFGVRHMSELAHGFHQKAGKDDMSTDQSITPTWGAAGYVRRSSLKK